MYASAKSSPDVLMQANLGCGNQHRGPGKSLSSEGTFVLVRVSMAVIEHHGQKQLGEEGVNLKLTLPHHSLSLREDKEGTQTVETWRQELITQRPWRGAAY